MSESFDTAQLVFVGCSLGVIAWQTWRGWRLGVMRQVVSVVALISAYATAFFGGQLALPILRSFGFPDLLLTVLSGAVLGGIVFIGISALGAVLFKKTSQQSLQPVRLGYGAAGAGIGLFLGLFAVWLLVLSVRVLGTVAETEVEMARATHRASSPRQVFLQGLVEIKQSMEEGTTGAVVDSVDPIPVDFYKVLHKISLTMSNPVSVTRFMDYPGAKELAAHPRIVALKDDESVTREIMARDFFALLRNENIVSAANDPDLHQLLRRFELEKALDYALNSRQN